MLPAEFYGQNVHFAINLFAALVFFAVFWLYFDAWLAEPTKKIENIYKWAGFLVVALSLMVQATIIQESTFGHAAVSGAWTIVITLLRLVGYGGIIAGQWYEPLQAVPDVKKILSEDSADEPSEPLEGLPEEEARPKNKKSALAGLVAGNSFGLVYLLPVGAFAIAALYWRRATKGLERHLRPVIYAFALLGGYELLSLANLYQNTSNPNVYDLVKTFGPLWIAANVLLLISMIILGKWVWHYLLERFISQLFIIFTAVTLTVFLLTTISFTFLLSRNIQSNTLDNLSTASSVLNYALNSKKSEVNAQIDEVAHNSDIVAAVVSKNHVALNSQASSFLGPNKLSSLTITTNTAQVLLREGNSEKWGDSVSSDSLVRRALVGEASSSIVTSQGVLAPVVSIRATVPIRDSNQLIVGTVSAETTIDNGFVDSVKQSTGLDSAVYGGKVLSATTFIAPDGNSRQIGVTQTDTAVTQLVLNRGQVFKGRLNILNRPFLAVYTPLKDSNNNIVGMLFIGQPQTLLTQSIDHSIQLTFYASSVLILLSIVPAFLISKYLSRQLE